jgi:hypothetical protein
MLRFLARALARLLSRNELDRVGHADLRHAHWDRALQLWVTHEDDSEIAPAA